MAERSKEEQAFMEKIQAKTHNGVTLRDLCIHGLRGMLGETPAQAVVYLMGEEAFEDPDLFVLRINEMFGFGARVIFRYLEEHAGEIADSHKSERASVQR